MFSGQILGGPSPLATFLAGLSAVSRRPGAGFPTLSASSGACPWLSERPLNHLSATLGGEDASRRPPVEWSAASRWRLAPLGGFPKVVHFLREYERTRSQERLSLGNISKDVRHDSRALQAIERLLIQFPLYGRSVFVGVFVGKS